MQNWGRARLYGAGSALIFPRYPFPHIPQADPIPLSAAHLLSHELQCTHQLGNHSTWVISHTEVGFCVAVQKNYGFRYHCLHAFFSEQHQLPRCRDRRVLRRQFDAAVLLYFRTLRYMRHLSVPSHVRRLRRLLRSEDSGTRVGYYDKTEHLGF